MARKKAGPSAPPQDGPAEDKKDASVSVRRWLAEIEGYDKAFKSWKTRCEAIIKRYRDEGTAMLSDKAGKPKFNILWANIQTLQPALYSRTPNPDISRRYKDRDPVGLAAAEILERSLSYSIDAYDFDGTVKGARDDYLLTARGQIWVRYVPHFGPEKTDKVFLQQRTDGEADDAKPVYERDDGNAIDEDAEIEHDDEDRPYIKETYRPLNYEEVVCDRIAWTDFGHTPAPVWEKVSAVWKKELLTRRQLIERFGEEVGKKVGLTKALGSVSEDDAKAFSDTFKRAEVYEIWDSISRKAIWISPSYKEGPLDEQGDPLGLKGFFPCPKPIYGTVTGDTLVPVPDYAEYQSQAHEIDVLTQRIDTLLKALKVAGAYDASAGSELGDILNGSDNTLIPVETWAMFAEKGGIKGAISFLPIGEIASVVTALSSAREQAKRDLYEISGIADIVRGQSNPNETLGAQRIKGQFAALRLQDRQADIARFVRDAIRIKAEVISEHFSPETLLEISGWMSTPMAEALDRRHNEVLAAVQAAQAQAEQQAMSVQIPGQAGGSPAQPGQTPAIPDQIPPSAADVFTQAVELLRNDHLRSFRIDIETDSTIAEDVQGDKSSATEFLGMVGGFLKEALPASQQFPQLAKPLTETLFFAMRRFKAGRQLEQTFTDAIEQMGQMPPPADKEKQAREAAAVEAQAKAQKDAADAQRQARADAVKFDFEKQKHTDAMALEGRKLEQEERIARQSGKVPIIDEGVFVALGEAVQQIIVTNQQMIQAAQAVGNQQAQMAALMAQVANAVAQGNAAMAQGLAEIRAVAAAPKRVSIERDAQGRIVTGTAVPVTAAGTVN